MYENIKKAIAQHERETLDKFNAEIETKTAGELIASWYYREQMTPQIMAALKQSNPDEKPSADLLERIKAKKARAEAKNTAARLQKLDEAERAHEIRTADVSVEFYRSKTWGYVPRADVRGWAEHTSDSASGCGYDKESAAIAGAMNANPEIMRILYDHAEKGQPFPYSVHTFAGVPSFDGGCGVSCFRDVFDACGYEWRQVASGRTYNAYTLTRKEEATK